MKIFIIGKENSKYKEASDHIRALNHEAILPHRNSQENFDLIRVCDAVYLLRDGEESEEAMTELSFARMEGKVIFKQINTGMSYFHDLHSVAIKKEMILEVKIRDIYIYKNKLVRIKRLNIKKL